MSEYTHGIRGTILVSKYSNGIFRKRNITEVILVGENVPALHPVRHDAPAVAISHRSRLALEPTERPNGEYTPYMASGAFVVNSGCREEWEQVFGHDHPIPLHDHCETWAQARMHD